MAEKFNADNVKNEMDKIDTLFEEFATLLSDIDEKVMAAIGSSPSSADNAIYGDLGSKLRGIWEENSSSFSEFKGNFDNWSQVASAIISNNIEAEEESNTTLKNQTTTSSDTTSSYYNSDIKGLTM